MRQDEVDKRARALNRTLIDELKENRLIRAPAIEAAFRSVLRHLFLPGTPLEEVYSDRAILAKQNIEGQWLSSSSQPGMMAIMLEQLDLQSGHKVLEIGTGTGYNAALMAHIVGAAGQVITMDIDEDLTEAARRHLDLAGYPHVQVVRADGGYGYPEEVPFDRIILTVGAPDIAPAWWDQLKPDGRLVLPLMLKGSMKSVAFEPSGGHLASISVKDCRFLPLRGDFASPGSARLQVGPSPGLYLEPGDEVAIEPDKVHRLLTGESRDWPTGVEASVWDVLNGQLWTWLALHEAGLCQLVAEGDRVESSIVPPLALIGGRQKAAATAMLADANGLAALMRPPGQTLTPVDRDKLFVPGSPFGQPFPLFVRQFGPDGRAAQRLIGRIQEWEAAGRPSSDGMRIRVHPGDTEYLPSGGELVIEKQWTKLVLEWPDLR